MGEQLTDPLTLAIGAISVVTMVLVLYMLVTNRRKSVDEGADSGDLASTMSRVEGLVSGLQAPMTQLVSTVGALKQSADETSTGMAEVMKFANLFTGSSQKRGRAGEIMIRQYFEKLPREMWEEQYTIPGTDGRVDFALYIYNNGAKLLLPVDSKFSLPEEEVEDFETLANALALARAKEVAKYIVGGVTMDIAVMVVPSPVFYALDSGTLSALQNEKVVPCPVEGVFLLCMIAVRAQQAVAIAHGAEKLRGYVIEINTKLGRVVDDVTKLGKSLRGASKWAKETLGDLEDTRNALSTVTTQLEDHGGLDSAAARVESVQELPIESAAEKPDDES